MRVHPDKTAIRAVDACGGTYSAEQVASEYAAGHTEALCEAMKAVVDADALTAEMFSALAPFAEIDGEGDEDFADDTKVVVTFGRTTHYALTLGDFRRARAAFDKAEGF